MSSPPFSTISSTSAFENAIILEEQPSYKDVPEFDDINNSLSNQLLEINNNLSNLNKNLNYLDDQIKKVKTSGGNKIDRSSTVDKHQKTSLRLINQLLQSFKELSNEAKKLNDLDTSLLNKSQSFVKDKLQTNITRSLGEFNELQSFFTSLEKKLNDFNTNEILIAEEHHKTNQEGGSQSQHPQQQQMIIEYEPINAEELEYQRNLIEERERDIESISNGVNELNEIFHDLSSLVISQGEIIDNIESNLYSTLHDTRMANKHLVKADKYQRNKRRFCFWVLIVLMVILLFILLVIFA